MASPSPSGEGKDQPQKEPTQTDQLLATTPAQLKLMARLTLERRAKRGEGAREIKRFPTLACKEKFEKVEAKLSITEIEGAINRAMEIGATSVPRAVDYINGFCKNGNNKFKPSVKDRPVADIKAEDAHAEYLRLNAHLIGQDM